MNRSEAGKLGYLKSRATLSKKFSDARKQYEGKPKLCKYCSETLTYEKRQNDFCGMSCAASFNNWGEPKKVTHGRFKKTQRACLECKTLIEAKGATKYCSHKCQQDHVYHQFVEQWLAGKIGGGRVNGNKVSSYVRRWLVEKYGEKCQLCGWRQKNPKTGRVPVQIDHEDGNPDNNAPGNLRLLCPNCHSLTPTFGALNLGHGRACRRKGYVPKQRKQKRCYCGVAFDAIGKKQYCSYSCAQKRQRKVLRPTAQQLRDDISCMTWVAIGKKYGVSDNAVRKWAIQYDLSA